tara:strand:+ start:85 stop:306 length:222 start_codon:yes stop_codon:yes gene_type:complete
MTDEQIRDKGLAEFAFRATEKFNTGIREHNPDGTKGLSRMATLERIRAAQDEAIDLWFYLYTEELSALGFFDE